LVSLAMSSHVSVCERSVIPEARDAIGGESALALTQEIWSFKV
jgi:hypothetical protein